MRTLKVISGPAAGESLGIEKEVVIGREGADLTITDPQISRRHTAVRPADGGGVEVEDLGSLNGTFVNGERLSKPMTLTSSGKIRVGDSDIEVEVEEAGLTQVAPAAVIADASATPARGSVRRVDDDVPAAAAAVAAAAPVAAAAAVPPPAAPPAVEQAPRRPASPARGLHACRRPTSRRRSAGAGSCGHSSPRLRSPLSSAGRSTSPGTTTMRPRRSRSSPVFAPPISRRARRRPRSPAR